MRFVRVNSGSIRGGAGSWLDRPVTVSADRVTLAAGDVSRQDLVSLEARHRRGWRVLVGNEKEAALAVADRVIFALEPGRAVGIVLCFPAGFMRGVLEWILDHGTATFPTVAASAVMPVHQL